MTVRCPECGGSGWRMGCTREIPCFDCGGVGEWEEEDEGLTDTLSDPFGDPYERRAA